ncbi:MAG: signal peptidase II [Acidobacteriota bacterium]
MRPVYLLIAACVAGLDQVTKFAVVANLSAYSVVPVVPGLFRLVRVENRGIAFGLFSDSSSALGFALLILFSFVALAIVVVLLWKNPRSAVRAGIGLSCILGGAASNLVDRVVRGSVIDFLDVYIGSYHWPAFNAADSAIVIGSGVLLLELFAGRLPNWDFGSSSTASSATSSASTDTR